MTGQDGGMGRIACLAAVVLVLAGCGGGDDKPAPPPAAPPASVAAPAPSASDDDPYATDEPSTQVTEEQDNDPSDDPGDLSDQGQAYLDEAVGTELGALESAPASKAGARRKTLENLPEEPDKVLAALRDYEWLSPEAKALYQKALKA
jgi:hypothetical protein